MSFKFFENKKCEYFPCHKELREVNCLFCFCPLYGIKECGGQYIILNNGIKDCTNCTWPHKRSSYDIILKRVVESKENG